jgi:hypothetical protein
MVARYVLCLKSFVAFLLSGLRYVKVIDISFLYLCFIFVLSHMRRSVIQSSYYVCCKAIIFGYTLYVVEIFSLFVSCMGKASILFIMYL